MRNRYFRSKLRIDTLHFFLKSLGRRGGKVLKDMEKHVFQRESMRVSDIGRSGMSKSC